MLAMQIFTRSVAPLLIAMLGVTLLERVQSAQVENENDPTAGDAGNAIQKIAGDYLALDRANVLGGALPNRSAATI
jgi:hypothetical protein